MPEYLSPVPNWSEEEKPTMPGSPSMPRHRGRVRLAYALISILLGLTGGLGTALVSANLPTIQGELGLTPSQGAWLPAVYLMVNVSMNLLLVKFRQQYGMARFAEIGLPIYAALTLLHLFANTFAMALLVRAASGAAGATVTTLATLYMLQAFGKKNVPRGFVLGIGISQLATPLAWLLSPALLDLGDWRTLYLFESGLALTALAAVVVLKLPPGIRIRVFEPLDFLTFGLLATGLALVGAVLAQGRVQWWLAQDWIAYAAIGAIVLITIAVAIEHHRKVPLLQTRWLGSAAMLRFTLGAISLRFILSEQTYGAVGLLQTLGMGPDQLQPLYAVLFVTLIAGIVTSAMTFSQMAVLPQILCSIVLIGVGSYLDTDSTSLTRPHDLYLSQGMLSFAAGMFLGPLLLMGVQQALKNGPAYLVSFVVLFSITQSIGGLLGPAVLGTFQVIREKQHSSQINEHLNPADAVVAQRLQIQSQVYARTQTDPVLRNAQGMAQLGQAATREANVLAFNDVFRLTTTLSLVFLGWSLFHTVRLKRAADRAAAQAA
ncbi:MAG: MFS transporter [Hydrocarboniphaga sp.]|jgi:MFS family permease|uniref:Putative transporter (MFS superfamily) protein n=2 Tax=Nevskiaceae TaxID=568386 RepID=I7ZIC0_9GAMM|nr:MULTISPECIES: MFS transporter [Hydrocarboniphaga]EIT71669.1 putative transporter (MFS superfamily) protein [Hydrocarboniphaga effusa AP103]MDZ4080293.1 MFS transporter [Hydrocarboniphaga sp.]